MREELLQKCTAAIDKSANSFTDGYCPTPYEITSEDDCRQYAIAVLTAIHEAGCTIVPNEATVEQREAGVLKLSHDPIIGDFMTTDAVYEAMLSASPFSNTGEG